MENSFAASPMPNHTITSGMIATGGNALNILKMGDRALLMGFILPVTSPAKIPIDEPAASPAIPRHELVTISRASSPLLAISTSAANHADGGGNKVILT